MTKNLFSSLPSFCHSEEQSDEESVFYRYCEDPSLNAQDDTGRNSDRNLEFFLGHIRLCHSEERSDEESFQFSPLFLSFRGAKRREICFLSILRRSFADAQDDTVGKLISALTHICFLGIQIRKQSNRLPRKHFDLPRNSHSTVPVYADECELLVFGTFLNSLAACRK